MDGDSAQQRFSENQLVLVAIGHPPQNFYGFGRDFRADAIARENQQVQLHYAFAATCEVLPATSRINSRISSLRSPFLRSARAVKRS